jgi:bifunctional enzyme CysN/CysC
MGDGPGPTDLRAASRAPRSAASRQDATIRQRAERSLLRFNTCGSVDDGKSTLIGRLLFESKALFDDQLAALEADSKKVGTRGGELDFALLLDGLSAEREQGITIDVAYRYFSTEKRNFIVADTPGHEEYTRNMVTGASTADLSVILVDARKGLLTQTRRHTFLVSLLGVRQVALVVNKMDLVSYSGATFAAIEADYRRFSERLGFDRVTCIPTSAVLGDNVFTPSGRTPWYRGPTLMELLDQVELDEARLVRAPFRFPVQWVNRPSPDFRGYAGTVVGGEVRPGDSVRVQPSGRITRVERIVSLDGDLEHAQVGQSVTLTLSDEVDVSRGDLIVPAQRPAEVADQFEATVVWMSAAPLLPGRSYWLKLGTTTVTATVAPLKYKINVDTLDHAAATKLDLNEIGVCNLQLDRAVPFDPFRENRDTGAFILIDRLSNDTVGAGMLHFALRRAQNVQWQALDVNKAARASIKGQKPCVLWYTGLSGAGKSTIANLVDKHLYSLRRHSYLLDGDNVRHGLNKDLGFTAADRVENIRRIAEVAKLMVDAGLIVSTAFISPFRAERLMARSLLPSDEFIEIFVDTPLGVAEARDPKGLYKKARAGALKNFTGIDSPYEPPETPELRIDTTAASPEQGAEMVIAMLISRGFLHEE